MGCGASKTWAAVAPADPGQSGRPPASAATGNAKPKTEAEREALAQELTLESEVPIAVVTPAPPSTAPTPKPAANVPTMVQREEVEKAVVAAAKARSALEVEALTLRLLESLAAREERVALPILKTPERRRSGLRGLSRSALHGARAFYAKRGALDKAMQDIVNEPALPSAPAS